MTSLILSQKNDRDVYIATMPNRYITNVDYVEVSDIFMDNIKIRNNENFDNYEKKLYNIMNIEDIELLEYSFLQILDNNLYKLRISNFISRNEKKECQIILDIKYLFQLYTENKQIPNVSYLFQNWNNTLLQTKMSDKPLMNTLCRIKKENLNNFQDFVLKQPNYQASNSYIHHIHTTRKDIMSIQLNNSSNNIYINILERKLLLYKPTLMQIKCQIYGRILITNIQIATLLLKNISRDSSNTIITITALEKEYWSTMGVETVLASNILNKSTIHKQTKSYIIVNIVSNQCINKLLYRLLEYMRKNKFLHLFNCCILSQPVYNQTVNLEDLLYDARWLNATTDFSNILKTAYVNKNHIQNELVSVITEKTYKTFFDIGNTIKPIFIQPSKQFINKYYTHLDEDTMESHNIIINSIKSSLIIPPIGQIQKHCIIPKLNGFGYQQFVGNITFNCTICVSDKPITDMIVYPCNHYNCYQCFIQYVSTSFIGNGDYMNKYNNPCFKCPYCNQEQPITDINKVVNKLKLNKNFIISLFKEYGKIDELCGYIKIVRLLEDSCKISKNNDLSIVLIENPQVCDILQYIMYMRGINNIILMKWNFFTNNNIRDTYPNLLKLLSDIRSKKNTKFNCKNGNLRKPNIKLGIYILDPNTQKPFTRQNKFINFILSLYTIVNSYSLNMVYKVHQYIIKRTIDEMIYENKIVFTN